MDHNISEYSNLLSSLAIEHEIIAHSYTESPVALMEYLKLSPAETLPTMVMKTSTGFIVIIRRGDTKIDFKKLRQIIGKNNRMATPAEFKDLTDLPVGAARVYIPNIKTFIDSRVIESEFLVGGSGNFMSSICYATKDLVRIPNSEVVDLSVE